VVSYIAFASHVGRSHEGRTASGSNVVVCGSRRTLPGSIRSLGDVVAATGEIVGEATRCQGPIVGQCGV
jgi:hypothetical protein